MKFDLPAQLLEALQRSRRQRGSDAIERAHDAYFLYADMGGAVYLTADGRVLVDSSDWDGTPVREATPTEACVSIVIGGKRPELSELLQLLPPKQGPRCPECLGTGWWQIAPVVCGVCFGLGWIGLFSPSSRD